MRLALDRRAAAAALLLASMLAPLPGAADTGRDPAVLLTEIRAPELEPSRAVAVRGVDLELGLARFEIEQGILIPTRPINGRTVDLVFVGRARFRAEPPDEIEAGQLELFTGRRTLDAPVESAVLVLADPGVVSRLIDRPNPADLRAGPVERARAFHEAWLGSAERRQGGVDAGIFRALAGDLGLCRFLRRLVPQLRARRLPVPDRPRGPGAADRGRLRSAGRHRMGPQAPGAADPDPAAQGALPRRPGRGPGRLGRLALGPVDPRGRRAARRLGVRGRALRDRRDACAPHARAFRHLSYRPARAIGGAADGHARAVPGHGGARGA